MPVSRRPAVHAGRPLGSKMEILAINQDTVESTSRILSALAARKGIDGMLGLGAGAAAAILQAMESPGIRDRMKAAGSFDLSPEILTAVTDGRLLFGIDEQPYLLVYLPIVFMKLYHDFKLMPAVNVNTGPNFVTKADAQPVLRLSKQGIR